MRPVGVTADNRGWTVSILAAAISYSCLRKQQSFPRVHSKVKVPKPSNVFMNTLFEVCHPRYSLHGITSHQKGKTGKEQIIVFHGN